MNPLRILVVTQDYPPPAAGGYGVMAADVCQLVERGHDVEVLTAADGMQRGGNACGSLMVSTAVGGSAEFCYADVNCLTYPAGDSTVLAAQIRRLASDAELRKRLGAAALETSQHFRLARQVDEIERSMRKQASGDS